MKIVLAYSGGLDTSVLLAWIKETYNAALDLGGEALIRLGFHPFHAEQLKETFSATEDEMVESMYQSWLSSTDSGMSPGYRELFMQQESVIRAAMQSDRTDRHSVSERAWNPPPKGYAEALSGSDAGGTESN